MGSGNRFPGHIQPFDAPSPFIDGKQGGQRDLYAHLGRQHAAVHHIRVQLSLGIVVGIAGIESVLPGPVGDQILQADLGHAADMAALPHAHIASVVEFLLPALPAEPDEPGIVKRVLRKQHGGKIVPVGVRRGILGQGSPVGDQVLLAAIAARGAQRHRQIPVSRGVDDRLREIDPVPYVSGRHHADPAARSFLVKRVVGDLSEDHLHARLQTAFQVDEASDPRMEIIPAAPDSLPLSYPAARTESVHQSVHLPHIRETVPEPVGAHAARRLGPSQIVIGLDQHRPQAAPGRMDGGHHAGGPAPGHHQVAALLSGGYGRLLFRQLQ